MIRTLIPLDGTNPISGLKPNYDALGAAFHSKALLIIAGLWALAILVTIGYLIRGLVTAAASARGGNPHAQREARSEAVTAAVVLGVEFALTMVVGAIAWIAS